MGDSRGMSEAAVPAEAAPGPSRLRRIVTIVLTVLLLGLAAYLLGWDVRGWFSELWDTITAISVGYLIAAVVLLVVQTTSTALAWFGILRYAYGRESVSWRAVLACYATAVALNGVLPANLGTLVSLIMFAAVVAGATFAGILGGYAVEKIYFTVAGAFVYLYLFLSVDGSFDIKFEWVHDHPWLTIGILGGAVVLVVLLVRHFWPKLRKFWESAKEGGAILAKPRRFLARVALPEFVGWCASLGVIAVFLAAYGIPVSFHTVMRIVGGNSIANVTSVTPGGVGVNQAFNVASLNGVTDATTATAYSVAQQLVATAWNLLFGIAAVTFAFGWSGGKHLVGDSYVGAKEKAAEQNAKRKERKAEKKAARKAAR